MHNDSSSKDADCYGVVEDGICKKCGEHTPGVVGYPQYRRYGCALCTSTW